MSFVIPGGNAGAYGFIRNPGSSGEAIQDDAGTRFRAAAVHQSYPDRSFISGGTFHAEKAVVLTGIPLECACGCVLAGLAWYNPSRPTWQKSTTL